jgi:hypothetical protein
MGGFGFIANKVEDRRIGGENGRGCGKYVDIGLGAHMVDIKTGARRFIGGRLYHEAPVLEKLASRIWKVTEAAAGTSSRR